MQPGNFVGNLSNNFRVGNLTVQTKYDEHLATEIRREVSKAMFHSFRDGIATVGTARYHKFYLYAKRLFAHVAEAIDIAQISNVVVEVGTDLV